MFAKYYVYDVNRKNGSCTDHEEQTVAFEDFMARSGKEYIALGIYKGIGACDILFKNEDDKVLVSQDYTKLQNFNTGEVQIIVDELRARIDV